MHPLWGRHFQPITEAYLLTVEQVRRERGEGGCRAEAEDDMAVFAFTLTAVEPLDEFEQVADIR